MLTAKDIAKVVHQANKAYCEANGDWSQKDWNSTPDNIKESAIFGVQKFLDNPDMTPQQQHQTWCEFKRNDGWTYGLRKDSHLKQHPCLVPWDTLPPEQKRKDVLFQNIIKALR